MKSVCLQRMKLIPWLRSTLPVLVMSVVLATASDVILSQAEGKLANTKIAFVSTRDGNHEIYVMNADGTNLINLTNHPTAADQHPSWSPDGRKIAFHSYRDGNSEIYVMNADGANPIRLTNHVR